MSKSILLVALFLFSPFLQGSQLPILSGELWDKLPVELHNKILNLCGFEKVISLKCLNKDFQVIIDRKIDREFLALKDMVKTNTISLSNFFATKLCSLDEQIVFQPNPISSDDRYNPLSLQDQEKIKLMRSFIHQIIDKESFTSPLYDRGNSSDFVAEKLNLKNYSLFYKIFCLSALFPSKSQTCVETATTENFKKNSYREYISLIDPYFKIKFFSYTPPHSTALEFSFSCHDYRNVTLAFNKNIVKPSIFVPFIHIMKQILRDKYYYSKYPLYDDSDILKDFEPKKL